MWNMFFVISQYFPTLTCLMFTCKLFSGKLGRVMVVIIIVMFHLCSFIFLLLNIASNRMQITFLKISKIVNNFKLIISLH